jgi:hypothetical protein
VDSHSLLSFAPVNISFHLSYDSPGYVQEIQCLYVLSQAGSERGRNYKLRIIINLVPRCYVLKRECDVYVV